MAKTRDAKWFRALVKSESLMVRVMENVCAVWFAAMIACMVWQVVSRFILHLSVPWTDEASRYLWITLAFIGAGAAISDNAHVEINIIGSRIKKIEDEKKRFRLARLSDIVRYVILVGLSLFLAYFWITFTFKALKLGQLSAAMMIPMTVPYIIIDIGVVSMIIHSMFRLIISIVAHDTIIDPLIVKRGEE